MSIFHVMFPIHSSSVHDKEIQRQILILIQVETVM